MSVSGPSSTSAVQEPMEPNMPGAYLVTSVNFINLSGLMTLYAVLLLSFCSRQVS